LFLRNVGFQNVSTVQIFQSRQHFLFDVPIEFVQGRLAIPARWIHVFSQSAPYACWEQFQNEGRRLWNLFRARLTPIVVARLAVRYINRNDVSVRSFDLKDYV